MSIAMDSDAVIIVCYSTSSMKFTRTYGSVYHFSYSLEVWEAIQYYFRRKKYCDWHQTSNIHCVAYLITKEYEKR